ncbi:MAG: tryptophan 7-halogenase, partial [Planctomycetes bacterium]|nr:tryptophan 7-halogenase [Planctomycetota bacterium]
QFVSHTGRESQPFYFFETNPQESSQTWQVWRAEFDQMLLDNARGHGVEVRVGARVLDVLFDGPRAVGVRVQANGGAAEEIPARVLIDASGQSHVIAARLGIREMDPFLKKGTVWTYYEGAERLPGIDGGATLVLYTQQKNGWFWYIPLPDDITSVGVVSSLDYLFARRRDPQAIYEEQLDCCPAARARVAKGRRVSGFYVTKDFSYRATRCAGEGWVLVGDAFGFLDPIYSSGVLLALKSGEMAADAVADGLARGDLSPEMLGRWEPEFTKGMDRMKRLVYLFYQGFSFGRFVRRYPQYKLHLIDLLVGNLFTEHVDEAFPAMEALMRESEPMPAGDAPASSARGGSPQPAASASQSGNGEPQPPVHEWTDGEWERPASELHVELACRPGESPTSSP